MWIQFRFFIITDSVFCKAIVIQIQDKIEKNDNPILSKIKNYAYSNVLTLKATESNSLESHGL